MSEESKSHEVVLPFGGAERRASIELSYSFFHQKQRIYQYSTLDWQKDDIEYAIEDYVSTMDKELYDYISAGRTDFLRNHTTFADDILSAVNKLEELL